MTLLDFYHQFPFFKTFSDKVEIVPNGSDFIIKVSALGRYYTFSVAGIESHLEHEFFNVYRRMQNLHSYNNTYKYLYVRDTGIWTFNPHTETILSPTKAKFDSTNVDRYCNDYDYRHLNNEAKVVVANPEGLFFCYNCLRARVMPDLGGKVKGAMICTHCVALDPIMKQVVAVAA